MSYFLKVSDPEDILHLPIGDTLLRLFHTPENLRRIFSESMDLGISYTLTYLGAPIAMCGSYPAGEDGVAMSWIFAGATAHAHPIAVFRAAKKVLALSYDVLQVHRLESEIDASHPEDALLSERLGFKKEGYHPGKWGPGRDVISYGRLSCGK